MARKPLLVLTLLLTLLLPACDLRGGATAIPQTLPTATPPPTPAPTATPTPPPPKPQVGYTPIPAGAPAPIVIQRYPRRGESLPPDGVMELVFDRPMDQSAVAAALTLQQAGEPPTPINVSVNWPDARTVQFWPRDPLPRAATFDVILTQQAGAVTGDPLREPYTFRFETAGYLEVAQVIPAPNTADVEPDAAITVMFNRPVVPLTTLAQMEDLPRPLTFEPDIKGAGEWLNTSIFVFTPAEPLTGGLTYTARVSAGLQDTTGALLADDYVWQFSTVPPNVVRTQPRDGDTLVGINTAVTVQFNQPVDPASARDAFSLTKGGLLSSAVGGDVSVSGNTLTFTPARPLDFDATYRAGIAAGVTSTGGGEGMRQAHTFKFTTVPLPKIVETRPADGERNAHPRTDFRIVFNAPIDPKTVMPNVTFSPPLSPTQVYTYFSSYNNTFSINFGAQPSADYRVTIKNGITDPYGNAIPKGRSVNFRTAPLPPNYQLRVPDFAATYDAARPVQIVAGHINVTRLNLQLFKLPLAAIERPYWELQAFEPAEDMLIRQWQQNLEAPANKQAFTVIDVAGTPGGALEPGLYLLDADSPDLERNRRYHQKHLLVVSDLNLTLKVGPKDALVWATDLATGQPVPNLPLTAIEVNGGPAQTVATDGDGVARLSLKPYHDSLTVYSSRPFAAVSDNWGRGISPWDFGLGSGLYSQEFRTYIYTDRPLYRPGQTVHFKGIIRAEDDAIFRLPDVGRATVTIRDAAYEEIFHDTLPLSELGSFNGSLSLEDGAALGQHVIQIEFAGYYAEDYFQVAAYRPPEFEIAVTPGQTEISRGDPLTATIEARYFFGGPLAGTAVEWNVLAERYTFTPPWGGRYSFSDSDDPYACFDCWWWYDPAPPQPILSGSGVTGPDGRLTLELDGAALDAALPFRANRLVIEASATGPDNQFISGRSPVIVHPGPYYIGLSPQKYVSQAGEESAVDVVVVDWTGERLPETAVTVEFYRREWLNTFIANELGGGYWDWDTKDTLLNTVTVTTNELGEAVAAFIPPKGGSYHIVAAPAEPIAAEKNIRSSIFIWVAGKEYVSWRRENNDRITLVSDKTAYRAGDTAEILIPSPFKGPHVALVTVERAGVLRHDVIRMESNSRIYRLPITGGDIPNIYVSVTLVKGRSATEPADFKMGLLPFDVALQPKTLTITVDADTAQAQPGDDVTYTLTAANPDGTPAAGAELSFDVVDKAVLSLQPRAADILSAFYARRALEVNTAAGLSVSANRYLQQLAEDLDLETAAAEEPVFDAAGGEGAVFEAETAVQATGAPAPAAAKEARAANVSPPAGVDIRQEFADTAFWNARLITDEQGQAAVTVTLPDNLTTWTARGVGFTAATAAGEATADVVATKPLLVRPVTPRFFVVDDRARLAANVNNNTGQDLEVEVSLSAEGVGVSAETPPRQTVTIPAHGEAKVTWNVTVDDVVSATLVFAAVSGDYADAAKPRLTTGPDGSLRVFRYTAPDIVGTAGQLTEGGSRAEAVALPPEFDARRGQLTVQLDPSLAAGMQDGLKYLEHFEYECTEQTVSRFLPNVLTFNALQSLGIENPELAARLPGLVDAGLNKLYLQQNPDGGWGWWYRPDNWDSNPHVSGYVVFALLKAEQTGVDVSDTVLANGLNYLQNWIKPARDFKNFRDANRQAWLLYVLAEGNAAPPETLTELFDNRAKLSYYARAYLAQALWLADKTDSRLPALLSDLNNAAILSATGAHWEEHTYDWWAMNTDTRTTAIVLDTLAKLDPGNALIPNAVRWLMVARTAGIWETTQETAWALIALTDWMVETGELDADYQYTLLLNDAELAGGAASRDTIRDSQKVVIPIADLVAGAANALTIARSDGNGRLYYTAHLEVHLPVEQIEPADRGISVSRRYTLASCTPGPACPEVREAKLGDVIRVDLTLIAPNDLYYLVLEDPLPAGGEAIDTGLATTSLLALDPALRRQDSPYWWWWRWYSRSELRDEKVVLFADYLSKGTYEYSYTFRATLPGDYHVIPAVAREFYFPEVFGRSDGRLLSIGR